MRIVKNLLKNQGCAHGRGCPQFFVALGLNFFEFFTQFQVISTGKERLYRGCY